MGWFNSCLASYWFGAMAMNTVMPVVGGAFAAYTAYKVLPVMYRWELIPGIGSPDCQARAATINYTHYRNGIVYDAYDTGEPRTEIPPESKGRMILKDRNGKWRPQE